MILRQTEPKIPFVLRIFVAATVINQQLKTFNETLRCLRQHLNSGHKQPMTEQNLSKLLLADIHQRL